MNHKSSTRDGAPATSRMVSATWVLALVALSVNVPAFAGQPTCPTAGKVLDETKFSAALTALQGELDPGDVFGRSVASVGDLDGDRVTDIVVGAERDDDGGTNRGAVWVLFLNADGTVKDHQKISDTEGGFGGQLDDSDQFGASVVTLGDLNRDGTTAIAVGSPFDDDGGPDRGAVWILFLNSTGTVSSHQKISSTVGGFEGQLDDNAEFGGSVALLGNLDDDGVIDIAVGAVVADGGGFNRGEVWVLFLEADGTVKDEQVISDTAGGFQGLLEDGDFFGAAVAALGDLDRDGVTDIAVGAQRDDDGGTNRGAVWVLFLNTDGTVKAHQKISSIEGGFQGPLNDGAEFGISATSLGDFDMDGLIDIAVGSASDDDGGPDRGAVWVLFLNANGMVKAHRKISSTAGSFTGPLDDGDSFGVSVAPLGDFDGDGLLDVAVGATGDDDAGLDVGAVWLLSLDGCEIPTTIIQQPSPCAVLVPVGGGIAAFTISAVGEPPLSYQWRRDGVPLVNGGPISGVDLPTLTLFATTPSVGVYDCVVSGGLGDATSEGVILAVRPSCAGDVNSDGKVDGADLGLLLAGWGLCDL